MKMRFILIFLLTALVTWFICDGLLWIEYLIKPYTQIGKIINTCVTHAVFIVASAWFAATIKSK